MTGSEAADLEDTLITLWRTQGPDAVADKVATLPPSQTRLLVILNVGSKATRNVRV